MNKIFVTLIFTFMLQLLSESKADDVNDKSLIIGKESLSSDTNDSTSNSTSETTTTSNAVQYQNIDKEDRVWYPSFIEIQPRCAKGEYFAFGECRKIESKD